MRPGETQLAPRGRDDGRRVPRPDRLTNLMACMVDARPLPIVCVQAEKPAVEERIGGPMRWMIGVDPKAAETIRADEGTGDETFERLPHELDGNPTANEANAC